MLLAGGDHAHVLVGGLEHQHVRDRHEVQGRADGGLDDLQRRDLVRRGGRRAEQAAQLVEQRLRRLAGTAALLERGTAPADLVAGARSPEKIADLAERGVRTVALDYDDAATVAAALDGVDTVLLISGSVPGARLDGHKTVIAAAREAGVRKLVYTSAPKATTFDWPLGADHRATEQALSEIYGLARHNVRKVLVKLNADGLVDLEPNRGAFIASPTGKEAEDMFELRQTLEQLAVQRVAQKATAADFATLRTMIEREREAYMQGNRPLWIRLSADFHIELAKLSGNDLLVEMLRRLVSRTTLLISNTDTSGQQPCSFDEHLLVLDALEKKNEQHAQHEMARHLEQCSCRMLKRPDKRFDLRSALGKD